MLKNLKCFKFGFELEAISDRDNIDPDDIHCYHYSKKGPSSYEEDYTIEKDSSVSGYGTPLEAVSRPHFFKEGLYIFNKIIRDIEPFEVNVSCGFHIHFSRTGGWNLDRLLNTDFLKRINRFFRMELKVLDIRETTKRKIKSHYYRDFPEGELKLFYTEGVLMLPSEY